MKTPPAHVVRFRRFLVLASLALIFSAAQVAAQTQPASASSTSSAEKHLTADQGSDHHHYHVRAGKVMSIAYHCSGTPELGLGSGVCSVEVSQQEFDSLVRAMDPNMTQDGKLSLAAEYARLLIMARAAQRRGLEQSAQVRSLEQFAILQVLATQLVKSITATTPQVSAADVDTYFRNHPLEYREVTLDRIVIPATSADGNHGTSQPAPVASEIRKRAANGESFSELQSEVAAASPIAGKSNVQLGPILCSALPEGHRKVCDLPPGTTSEVLADTSACYIYRVKATRARGLEEVRDDIRAKLERDQLQHEIERMRNPISLELNEDYFGKLPSAEVAHRHGMHFPSARTTASSHENSTPK